MAKSAVHSRTRPARPRVWVVVILALLIASTILTIPVMLSAVPTILAGGETGFYRVRSSWDAPESQTGAFVVLENAVKHASRTEGARVYDADGREVWPGEQAVDAAEVEGEAAEPVAPAPVADADTMYFVRTAWSEWRTQLGAFRTRNLAIAQAEANPGYQVYDDSGQLVHGEGLEADDAVVLPAPTAVPEVVEEEPVVEASPPRVNLSADNTERGWSWLGAQRWQSTLEQYGARARMPEAATPTIYLSFDAGYEYEDNTAAILDILQAQEVRATFFLNDAFIRYSPDTTRRLGAEGHVVGNHGYGHLNMPQTLAEPDGLELAQQELLRLEEHYAEVTGRKLDKVYRPAAGIWSEQTLALAESLGYTSYLWSYAYLDWDTNNQPDPAWALQQLQAATEPGAIIELHAISDTNVAIMADYIEWARAQGYRFGVLGY